MHEKVKQFLEEAQRKIAQKELAEREQTLVQLGLFEWKDVEQEEAGRLVWNSELNKYCRQKAVAIQLTDEEYQAVVDAAAKAGKIEKDTAENEDGMQAEDVVAFFNVVMLIFAIIGSIVMFALACRRMFFSTPLFIGALGLLLCGILGFCCIKVWLKQAVNIQEIKQIVNQMRANKK